MERTANPVSKVGGPLLASWDPKVRERLLRILHFTAFLISGLSAPTQDVLWFIDEDEIAANTNQLTRLTQLLAGVSASYMSNQPGHLRCGTTRSDPGSLWLEDIVAICDLGAGALCEIATGMSRQSSHPVGKVITPIPSGLSGKTRLLATWLSSETVNLQKLTCMIELSTESQSIESKIINWHAVPSEIISP